MVDAVHSLLNFGLRIFDTWSWCFVSDVGINGLLDTWFWCLVADVGINGLLTAHAPPHEGRLQVGH